MNIKTVAVYSEIDKNALHTKLADEAICIGPANPKQSYLNIKNIIEAANITKSDSIHPGFGFNIGYPISFATFFACSMSFSFPFEPGITGTPAFFIISLLFDLFPQYE